MNTVAVFSAPILGLAIIGATNKSRHPSSGSQYKQNVDPFAPAMRRGLLLCRRHRQATSADLNHGINLLLI